MTFGGLGCNPFNPALVGRVFLLVSFPVQMTTWPVPGQMAAYLDAETGATPLAVMKEAIKSGDASVLQRLPDAIDMLVGQTGGCLGEVSALALLIGLAYMLARRIVTWHIPVSILATVFVLAGLLHLYNPVYASPVTVLLTGGMMLGACFMATDYDRLVGFLKSQLKPRSRVALSKSKHLLFSTLRGLIKAYGTIMFITFSEVAIGLYIMKLANIYTSGYIIPISIVTCIIDIIPVLGTGTGLIPWPHHRQNFARHRLAHSLCDNHGSAPVY